MSAALLCYLLKKAVSTLRAYNSVQGTFAFIVT